MLPSNIYTVLELCSATESNTTFTKDLAWGGKPGSETPDLYHEDFNDHGDNWSANGWPTEKASDHCFAFNNPNLNSTWGNGKIVPIPPYHTHFTVLDSLDQRSGDTHYLLENNRGMLFHGHLRTSEWVRLLKPNSDGSEFASLSERTFVPTDYLFTDYRPYMTKFHGNTKEEAVYMKKQALLKRSRFKIDFHACCTAQEIQRCELISVTPHPNLAKYLGVETKQIGGAERVVVIACQRYSMDLYTFVLVKRYLLACHVPFLMEGIENGMRHLHSLGLVHCDLRPMNVFVTFEKARFADAVLTEVVIGDFDASVEIGAKVALKRACGNWWPEKAKWGDKAETWMMSGALIIWRSG